MTPSSSPTTSTVCAALQGSPAGQVGMLGAKRKSSTSMETIALTDATAAISTELVGTQWVNLVRAPVTALLSLPTARAMALAAVEWSSLCSRFRDAAKFYLR